MKLLLFFYTPPLIIAIENGYTEIVKLLLSSEKIDINQLYKISYLIIFYSIYNRL